MSLEVNKESAGGPKFVRKTAKKTRKKTTEATTVASEPLAPIDLNELVKGASEHVKGVFIGDDDTDLLSVKDWITMPEPIAKVIGKPGIPCGLITMAYGKKDCGKTTFATEALASTQRDGGIAILLDTEHKYDLERAKSMGLKNPIIIQAHTIEEAFDKFVAMIGFLKNAGEYYVTKGFKTKGVDYTIGEVLDEETYKNLSATHKKNVRREFKYANRKICCVWDSLGATPSNAELDESVTDFSMTAAKVIKGRIRKVLQYIKDTKVAFVIINQVYSNMAMFGKKITPYGGSGPEYHSALILEFAKLGHIRPPGAKSGEDWCGIRTQIEVVKNHMAQPFKKVEVQIDHKGFVVDRSAEYAPELKEEADESIEEVPEPKAKRTKRKTKS